MKENFRIDFYNLLTNRPKSYHALENVAYFEISASSTFFSNEYGTRVGCNRLRKCTNLILKHKGKFYLQDLKS